jgi:hypothetical protein
MGLRPPAEHTREPRSDLLRPSLTRGHEADRGYPYSVQALVLTAFIGGSLALVGLLGYSAQRRGRFLRDLPWLAVFGALWPVVIVILAREVTSPPGPLGLSVLDAKFLISYGGRFLALAFVGVYYLCNRHLYRALESLGRASPEATIPAVICSLVGIVTTPTVMGVLE